MMMTMMMMTVLKLDGCIVWNAHYTVFSSKHSAICAQTVYFMRSTMPCVTCLQLSDVSVICRVTYLQFFQLSLLFFYVGQPGGTAASYLVYKCRTADVAENLGRFFVRSILVKRMTMN